MFVNIYLSSKNQNSLKTFLRFFSKLCLDKKIQVNIFSVHFQKQKQKQKITVLKSPHVNKQAQEHFEFCMYKKQISVYSFQSFKFLIILKKIQLKLFPDVRVKIKFLVNNNTFTKIKRKKFNPKIFFSPVYIKKNLTTQSYLKLFDIYGETGFGTRTVKLKKALSYLLTE
jgi:ribosomal protein S10